MQNFNYCQSSRKRLWRNLQTNNRNWFQFNLLSIFRNIVRIQLLNIVK